VHAGLEEVARRGGRLEEGPDGVVRAYLPVGGKLVEVGDFQTDCPGCARLVTACVNEVFVNRRVN
jgi:hypothetical protein